jgi:hypothetical protein
MMSSLLRVPHNNQTGATIFIRNFYDRSLDNYATSGKTERALEQPV